MDYVSRSHTKNNGVSKQQNSVKDFVFPEAGSEIV
jgi:hypothetical protein